MVLLLRTLLDSTEIRSPIPNIGRLKDIEEIIYNSKDIQNMTAAKLGFIANSHGISHMRYIKVDGNGFYRAFMFAYVEKIIKCEALQEFYDL